MKNLKSTDRSKPLNYLFSKLSLNIYFFSKLEMNLLLTKIPTMKKTLLFFLANFLCLNLSYAQPNNIQSLPCGSPDNFSLSNSGFVGSTPTTAAGSCGQCCYQGSDLDGDGDQDVSYSVENSVWYEYCNSSSVSITIDIVIDEVFNNCNVQGAVFTGDPNNMDVDCSNPGFQEFGSNPGGNADGFSFTVTLAPGDCAWVMIDGYGGATCNDLTIEVPCCTAPTSVNAGTDVIICEGQSVALNGSISGGLVANGGPTFSWSPINGLSCANCQSPSAAPTATTTYTLTACNDALGTACCLTDQITVNVIPVFLPDAGADITACAPSSVLLGGAPTGPNGSSYSWAVVGPDNPDISISSLNASNPTVSINSGASGTETYEVTVTNGPCIFTDQVVVTVGPLAVDAGLALQLCAGESITIGGSPTAPAGSNYNWTCISNCTDISFSSSSVGNPTVSCGPSSNGTATFSVQASLGTCNNTDVVDLTINPLPLPPIASANPLTVCAGSATILSASSGAGSGSYSWWDAASGGTLLGSGNSISVSPIGTTTYFLESTDPTTLCASQRSPITINTTVAAVANAGADATTCAGTAFNLAGSIINPESCAAQTWSIVSGSGSFFPNNSDVNAVFTPTTTGQVELMLSPCTSGSGCPVVVDNILIDVTVAPTLNAWPDNDTLCFDEGLITNLNSITTGGNPAPTTINNSFNAATGPFPIPNNDCVTGVSVPITVTGVADPIVGLTTVSVCLDIDLNSVENIQIELCAPSGSPCILLSPNNNTLSGNNFTGTCFTDSSSVDLTAGAAPFNSSFNPYGTVSMSDLNGVATNGTWTLTVYDCTGKQSGVLNDWSISFDTPLPNDPYTYQWTPSLGVADPNSPSTTFSSTGWPASTVTKTLTVSDDNNCTASHDINIELIDCSILLNLESPFALLQLKASKYGYKNRLFWEVANASDKHGYSIERSKDGIHFYNIAFIEPSITNATIFEFIDSIPLEGLNYYRIQLMKLDGTVEISNTVALEQTAGRQGTLQLYPNPAQSKLSLDLFLENTTKIQLRIYNTLGEMVLEKKLPSFKDILHLDIDISSLAASNYQLILSTNNKVYNRTFIKN